MAAEPQRKGEALLVIRAINATHQLMQSIDNFRDVMNEYGTLGYNAGAFHIETLQAYGIDMRSFYLGTPSTATLLDAVGSFLAIDTLMLANTKAHEANLRKLLEFIEKG
jgi:hypothetical protein